MGGIDYHLSDSHEPSSKPTLTTDRKFIPSELYGAEDFDTSYYDDPRYDQDWTFVPCPCVNVCEQCGGRTRHIDSLFIAVDGACRGNGTPKAQSAIGVYFGKQSQHNVSLALHDPEATNQKAELMSCLMALTIAYGFKMSGIIGLSQIIIKSDSEYVVKGMTDWMIKWKKNGFKNARGSPVQNALSFKEIDQKVTEMNEIGIQVLFWHVPRTRNQEADRLANAAFESNVSNIDNGRLNDWMD
ncbi:hypothetical protein MMC28_004581 [Mycoblastus sanguinarius]|nr:hypothetical protein [Mycoblastus sanguinarius]